MLANCSDTSTAMLLDETRIFFWNRPQNIPFHMPGPTPRRQPMRAWFGVALCLAPPPLKGRKLGRIPLGKLVKILYKSHLPENILRVVVSLDTVTLSTVSQTRWHITWKGWGSVSCWSLLRKTRRSAAVLTCYLHCGRWPHANDVNGLERGLLGGPPMFRKQNS